MHEFGGKESRVSGSVGYGGVCTHQCGIAREGR